MLPSQTTHRLLARCTKAKEETGQFREIVKHSFYDWRQMKSSKVVAMGGGCRWNQVWTRPDGPFHRNHTKRGWQLEGRFAREFGILPSLNRRPTVDTFRGHKTSARWPLFHSSSGQKTGAVLPVEMLLAKCTQIHLNTVQIV